MKIGAMGSVVTLSLLSLACAEGRRELAESNIESKDSKLTLMVKPGTQERTFTEAGRDIDQVGDLTVYTADFDANPGSSVHEGTVHLFRAGAPVASYRAATNVDGSHMGYAVGLSENWLATDLQRFPFAGNHIASAIMIVGKNSQGDFNSCGNLGPSGEIPNCIQCSGTFVSEANTTLSCSPLAGIELLQPTGLSPNFQVTSLELEGSDLIVATKEGKVVPLWHDGSRWVESPALTPRSSEIFTGAIALSKNRLAVGGKGLNSSGHVSIYERDYLGGPWTVSVRVLPNDRRVKGFGGQVKGGGLSTGIALSGNSLVVTDDQNTHFIDLVTGDLPFNSGDAVLTSCIFRDMKGDVALSGSNAVIVPSGEKAITMRRNFRWELQGGLPEALYPRDVYPGTNTPTDQNFWGAAVDGDRVAVGWRNYRGENANTVTGGAVGFSFMQQDCGNYVRRPDGVLVAGIGLSTVGLSGPAYGAYPLSNMVDGESSTRWVAPQQGGTTLSYTFSEEHRLAHLQIDWGGVYSSDYTVFVSEDGQQWFEVAHVQNGNGERDFVDLSQSPAFGTHLRLVLNSFVAGPSAQETGVSMNEIEIYGAVHERCNNKPILECAGEQAHVCSSSCGRYNEAYGCYCDEYCEHFDDCCSFDGSDRGSEYFSGSTAICGD